MTDLPAQIKINRLERDLQDVAANTSAAISAAIASGIGAIDTYINLRAATNLSLTHSTIALRSDINGNSGFFSYDSTSTAADDGANVIVDLAGRRWVRWGSLV